MRKFLAVVTVVAACLFVVPQADAASGHRHAPLRLVGSRTNAEYSVNWSGYAIPAKAGQHITAVSGSWIVPLIRNLPPGYSSSWIGVGGYGTSDLIQTGTASSGKLERSHAWVEMLPDVEAPITSGCSGDASCTVSQGDRISASVTNTVGNTWVVTMTDMGRWSWSKTLTYASTLSSAEWVFEAPQVGYLGLGLQTIPANAPHAKFLGGGSYRVNGVDHWLAGSGAQRVLMLTATPSFLGSDGHFTVCAYKTSCRNF